MGPDELVFSYPMFRDLEARQYAHVNGLAYCANGGLAL
jgi:hypothetical protein